MTPTSRKTRLIVIFAAFFVGVSCGGFLFARTLPRSFVGVSGCGPNCLSKKDLAGLVVSLGIQNAPELSPNLALESEKCVAIDHPWPESKPHFVLFPKRDLKDIGSMTDGDAPYVLDCLAMVRILVEKAGLQDYRVYTNGPGLQEIGYLHFHVSR